MELSAKKIKIIKDIESFLLMKGTSNLSVREIASAAKINIAMISYYFGSKDQIIEAVVSYRYNCEKQSLRDCYKEIKKDPDIKSRIEKIIDLYVDKMYFFKVLQRITEENINIGNNCRADIIGFHMVLVEIFNENIQEGIEKKTFTPIIDLNMQVGSIIGTVLFFIKSRVFVQEFITKDIPEDECEEYLSHKLRTHLKTTIFLMLGN